jgi:hypothetical protein
MCLGIEPLFDLSIFIAVDKVKDCITRCEKIIEHTGTPVNIDEKDNCILVNH